MSEMTKEQKEYYLDQADKHANFLAEKVFKPAFIIAFVHGVKHGRKDATLELKAKQELHFNKLKLKDKLNREHKLRQRNKKKMAIQKLKVKIIKYCYWYYVKCHPLISDYQFDKLFKELERREKEEGATPDSPTQMIYGDRESTYPEYLRNQKDG